MRNHIRREAAAYEVSAAWFIVPMSVAAAVLIAVGIMGNGAEAETPTRAAPIAVAPAAVPAAPAAAAASGVIPASEPLPEAVGHVQAF
jgi:hypothetical protein